MAVSPALLRNPVRPLGTAFFSLVGMAAFLCGLVSQVGIDFLGELFWAEILLPLLAVGVMLREWPGDLFRSTAFRVLVVAAVLLLIGYVISDLVAGTPPERYLRGWSRAVVLASNLFSLAVICHRNIWNLWWYWLGWAIFGLGNAFAMQLPITHWKVGYGDALAVLAAAVSALLPAWIAAVVLGCLGGISIVLDYRSLGAVLVLVAAFVLIGSGKDPAKRTKLAYFLLPIVLGAAVIAIGVLLARSESLFSERRELSNVGRFAALKIGAIAIADSPIVGYGSWGQGTEEYARMLYRETIGDMLSIGAGQQAVEGDTLLAHSQLIQSWMEGGILAASFFIAYGWLLVKQVHYLVLVRARDALTSFFLLLLLINLWHLLMSPFLGAHRLDIASAAALVIILAMERRPKSVFAIEQVKLAITPPNLLR